ncbi:MAG TPA: helix-turn-helix transcriptional regulator [Caulobacter sp.]|nr:helix-turn-helix transcriptional regulator [Caulobacter sp.]
MSELAKTFGINLKALRNARGLTQVALGEAASKSEEWVRKMERGEGRPSFDTIANLAAALHVAPAEFFAEEQRSRAFEELLAQASTLEPRELDWLVDLLRHLKGRPGR